MNDIELKERNEDIALMLNIFIRKTGKYEIPDNFEFYCEGYGCTQRPNSKKKRVLSLDGYKYVTECTNWTEELKFDSDWNWLMEAVNFIKKNFRISNDTTDAKINELFIDEWEFKVNKYYIRLIQWTNDGWRMFNGKNNNDDLSMFYIIGENCTSEKEAVFKAISDFAKVYNKNKI